MFMGARVLNWGYCLCTVMSYVGLPVCGVLTRV